MKKPKKRQIYIIAGVVILILAIFITSRFFKMDKKSEEQAVVEAQPVVSVFTAEPDSIQSYINFTGRIKPVESIRLAAEVSGVLQSAGKPFETGVEFRRGQLLVRIENQEAAQNLKAQKSSFVSTLSQLVPNISIDYPDQYKRWKNYLENFDVDEPLPPLPEVNNEQFRLYLTGNNLYTQYNNIKQQEIRFNKYRIYAPFDGTLTSTEIEEGTLVSVGQNLGEYMNIRNLELVAAFTTEEIEYADIGQTVQLKLPDQESTFRGRITRVNSKIDPQTQTVKAFIEIYNPGELKPGSYMSGRVKARQYSSAIKIDNQLLVQNDYLYVVKDSVAALHPIEIKYMSRDSAIVGGLTPGMMVINEVKSPSFAGSRVNVE